MLDDLNPPRETPRASGTGAKPAQPQRAKKDQEVRPVVEREVPLGQQKERVLAASVHAWLDGELPEAAVRTGNTSRDVEFWRGVSSKIERSRFVRTPQHVEAQIMSALPNHVPQLITPWYRREFVITPMAAVSVAAALMTLAAAAAVLLLAP